MDACFKAFWLPKDGCSEEEYEDAFFPRNSASLTGQQFRFAVADGATEASFSRLWARMLVRAFVRRTLRMPLTVDQLASLREQWAAVIHGRTLPWYAEEKAASGAFSSLLGLELSENRESERSQRTWRATAVGDSCLAQISGDKVICAFPLTKASAFNNRPSLLGSLASTPVDEPDLILEVTGEWAREDQFLLMTDALACWFLRECEDGSKPWALLREACAHGQKSFRRFVADLRHQRALKNDDVTLMRIDILE